MLLKVIQIGINCHLNSHSVIWGTKTLEMIAELERHRQNISFDSQLVYTKTIEEVNISTFKEFFREETGEELTIQVLKKLGIIGLWGNGLKLIAEELQSYPEIIPADYI